MRPQRLCFLGLLAGVSMLAQNGCDTESTVEDPDLHYFVKYYGGDGDQSGVDMLALDDGTFMLLGNYTETVFTTNIYLVRVDADGEVLWERRIRGPGGNNGSTIWNAKDLDRTNDGNFVVVADFQTGIGSPSDVKLFKISPDGVPLDSVVYSTPANDYSRSVTPLRDGGFLISGVTEYTATYNLANEPDPDLGDIFNFRVDANLDLPTSDWSPVEHGFGSNLDVAVQAFQKADTVFYVFGYTNSTLTGGLNPNKRLGLFYFQRNGNGSWVNIFYPGNVVAADDTEINYVGSLPAELGGGFVVIGSSTNNLAISDIFVARMRNTLGFAKPEDDAPFYRTISLGRNIRGVSAAPSLTGEFGYLILGNEVRSTSTNIWLSKINQGGNVLWSTTLGSEAENDFGAAVTQLPDGKIVVLGTIGLADNQQKMALIKMNAGGKFLK